MSTGFPESLYLDEFGSQVWFVFGSPPYLVGTALTKKRGWRDVDVRTILSDDEWQKWEFGDPTQVHWNGKWRALCSAFSELGRKMTGLPIDFQIQQQTWANDTYKDEPRSAIILIPLRRVGD